jgi:hypothetical protein
MKLEIHKILSSSSDDKLANLITEAFIEVEKNYTLQSWKTSGLDAGHFIEGVRRFLEYKLFKKYTSLNEKLASFNSGELQKYERQDEVNTSFNIIIPRLLYGIASFRNKRGIIHTSEISPNRMDACYILATCKWVLAEIIRIESNLDFTKATQLIEKITERNIEGIWKEGEVTRILNNNLSAKEKILFLLYDSSPIESTKLIQIIEYKNTTNFTKILQKLHSLRYIELRDNNCIISPRGSNFFEQQIFPKIKEVE